MRGEVTARVTVPLQPSLVHAVISDVQLAATWHRDTRHVRTIAPRRSIWTMHGPLGPLKWAVETTVDRPDAFALSMRGDDMAGYLRFQMSPCGPGTTVQVARFLGFRPGPEAQRLHAWWGDAAMRLEGDVAHLVAVLKASVPMEPPVVIADHHLEALRFPDARASRT